MTKRRAEQSADALYWDAAGSGSTMKKQRCCGASSASLCGVNAHLDGIMAAATARMLDPLDPLDPPSLLLAVLGSRCRKRPYYYNNYNNNDDPPEQREGAAQRRKTCSHADTNSCVSQQQQTGGSFPGLHASSRSDHHHHKRLRPDDDDDDDGDVSPQNTKPRPDGGVTQGDADPRTSGDLCTFNSFQYWRVPLPVIDQSLLEDMNSQSEPREKPKDKGCSPDAMET